MPIHLLLFNGWLNFHTNITGKHDRPLMSTSVRVAKSLFFVMGSIWLVLSIFYLIKFDVQKSTIFMSILMVINAAIFYWLGWGIARNSIFFTLGIIYLLINIALTLTDQFGSVDLLTLLMDMVLLVLLIIKHRTFWILP